MQSLTSVSFVCVGNNKTTGSGGNSGRLPAKTGSNYQ